MPQKGSSSVTVKAGLIQKLEALRVSMGKRSWPQVVEELVDKELKRRHIE